jgi:uncharacterized protein YqfA (UPF0365 family)
VLIWFAETDRMDALALAEVAADIGDGLHPDGKMKLAENSHAPAEAVADIASAQVEEQSAALVVADMEMKLAAVAHGLMQGGSTGLDYVHFVDSVLVGVCMYTAECGRLLQCCDCDGGGYITDCGWA